MIVTEAERESLRQSYLAGETMKRACYIAGVSCGTAHRYFHMFAARGLVRGLVKDFRRRRRDAPPRYTGPTWIGKRA